MEGWGVEGVRDNEKEKRPPPKKLTFFPLEKLKMIPLRNYQGDNDPVDVVEIGEAEVTMGSVTPVKPLGVLAMIDVGELDWKVSFFFGLFIFFFDKFPSSFFCFSRSREDKFDY